MSIRSPTNLRKTSPQAPIIISTPKCLKMI